MTKFIFILLIASLTIIACKKENNRLAAPIDTPQNPVNAFFPMVIGNYWVYEFSTKLQDGSIVGTPSIDTLKIVGDTLINDTKYLEFVTNKPTQNRHYFYRDSMAYIIDYQSRIILLPEPDDTQYYFHYGFVQGDTAYSYWEEFEGEFTVSMDFGTFESIAQVVTHQAWPNYGGNTIKDTAYYSEIGPLTRSYAYLSGVKMVGTLIDFHLED
jgi:hypothetical protein